MPLVLRSPLPSSREPLFLVSRGCDVIAQAHSGTGTTATFAVSILQQIELRVKATRRALVLAYAQELTQQIQNIDMVVRDCLGASNLACLGWHQCNA